MLGATTSKTISFVIPVRPGYYPEKALAHIAALNYPLHLVEVLIAEGSQPSLQRNIAVDQAKGEIIYFLDDDTFISPDSVSVGLNYIDQDQIGAVGGPALAHSYSAYLEKLLADVLGSAFGTFTTRTRMRAIGTARIVRGEELILCNLMIQRKIYQKMLGLNVQLYPNEENEFLKRMREVGYRFYYLPEMIVMRTTRDSILGFVKQMFSYGSGRGHHILSKFSAGDLMFFVPSALLIYLIILIVFPSMLMAIPLMAYLLFIACGALQILKRRKSVFGAMITLPLFCLMHLSYGAGLLRGLFRGSEHKKLLDSSIKIARINLPIKEISNEGKIARPALLRTLN
jgi:succinoglycan biosynthesis protein ExoA